MTGLDLDLRVGEADRREQDRSAERAGVGGRGTGLGRGPRLPRADEQSWLRCRVLGFLDTAYFDDVLTTRPAADPGLALVAVSRNTVIGLLDASVAGATATIETITVHPDHRRRGIGRALLTEIRCRLAEHGAEVVQAWTRDDVGTLAWYSATGFVVRDRYLHVYASFPGEAKLGCTGRADLEPRRAFFHAAIGQESELRAEFSRVHVCHQVVAPI